MRINPTVALVTTALTLGMSPTPAAAGDPTPAPTASAPAPVPEPQSEPSPTPEPAGPTPTPAQPASQVNQAARAQLRERVLAALAAGRAGKLGGGERLGASLTKVRAELARRSFALDSLASGRLVDAAGRLPASARPGSLYLDLFSAEKHHAVLELTSCRFEDGAWQPSSLRLVAAAPPTYAQALARAKQLKGFRYLDTRRYDCANRSFEVARFLHPATGLTFHLLPGGVYTMGDGGGSRERMHSGYAFPQRLVGVRPVLVSSTECTEAAWAKVMGRKEGSPAEAGPLPVDEVSWHDAQAFCAKAGLRLPSEAEWEYACRAGTNFTFCFGGDPATLPKFAVVDRAERAPVASLLPNAFGLYDVHGNLAEWCEDTSSRRYTDAHPRDGSAYSEPSRYREQRGWNYAAFGMRIAAERGAAYRSGVGPEARTPQIGFRPVASLWPEDE